MNVRYGVLDRWGEEGPQKQDKPTGYNCDGCYAKDKMHAAYRYEQGLLKGKGGRTQRRNGKKFKTFFALFAFNFSPYPM